MRNINDVNFIIVEYLFVNFRILNTIVDDTSIVIDFIKHFYIVDNLKIKILFNNNIFEFKQITLNIVKKNLLSKVVKI